MSHLLFKVIVVPLVILIFSSSDAYAHHGSNTPGALWGKNINLLRLDAEQKAFATHNALSLVPFIAYAPLDILSLGARLPFSRTISYGDGAATAGLGDLELNLQMTAFTIDKTITLLVGAEGEIPIGDAASGLSGGHYALSPFTTLTWQMAPRWLLAGSLQYTHGFENSSSGDPHDDGHDHDHAHGNDTSSFVLNPHSTQEISAFMGASYLSEKGYVTFASDITYGLSAPEELGPIQLINEVGMHLTKELTTNLRVEMPVAGNIRESWTLTTGLLWRWGTSPQPSTSQGTSNATPEEDCDCPPETHIEEDCDCPAHQGKSTEPCEECDNPKTD
jgi:hypothetical protein